MNLSHIVHIGVDSLSRLDNLTIDNHSCNINQLGQA